MKRRRKRRPADDTNSSYTCPTCGETIIIPLHPSAGSDQEYIEDCPVCQRRCENVGKQPV